MVGSRYEADREARHADNETVRVLVLVLRLSTDREVRRELARATRRRQAREWKRRTNYAARQRYLKDQVEHWAHVYEEKGA